MANHEHTLTAEEARKLLRYDPETGDLFWRVVPSKARYDRMRNSRHGGKKAGVTGSDGRVQLSVCGRKYRAHRIIWLIVHGHWPKDVIDHRDGDPSNNRLENLREASHAENLQNMKRHADNTSGFLGVSWSKAAKKWRSDICVLGQRHLVGYFDTPEAASKAYLAAKAQKHRFQPEPRES